MIFPIGDTNVRGGYKPIFAYTLIALNVIIFFAQLSTPGQLVCDYATIPGEVMRGNSLHTVVTSMFLHGGWMHLIGNMMFLWIFADNIEAVVGNSVFILFYLAGGIFATMIHILFDIYLGAPSAQNCCMPCGVVECVGANVLCSGYVPSLGASGAISAVMGAYLVMFPKSRIKMLFFFSVFTVPAIIFLGFWFFQQMVSGLGSINPEAAGGGVAWWAHIGGFVVGLIFGWLNRNHPAQMVQSSRGY